LLLRLGSQLFQKLTLNLGLGSLKAKITLFLSVPIENCNNNQNN
jgi:hypothetical protein